MEPLRQLADLLEPLALLRAVVAAWPLGVAIMFDWPIIRWWLRSAARRPRQRVPSIWLAVLVNLAAAGSTLLAVWSVERLLGWLPGQFGSDILTRTIAERRTRVWEAALLVPTVTLCVLGAKALTLRMVVGRWPALLVWGSMACAWCGLLAVVWIAERLVGTG